MDEACGRQPPELEAKLTEHTLRRLGRRAIAAYYGSEDTCHSEPKANACIGEGCKEQEYGGMTAGGLFLPLPGEATARRTLGRDPVALWRITRTDVAREFRIP